MRSHWKMISEEWPGTPSERTKQSTWEQKIRKELCSKRHFWHLMNWSQRNASHRHILRKLVCTRQKSASESISEPNQFIKFYLSPLGPHKSTSDDNTRANRRKKNPISLFVDTRGKEQIVVEFILTLEMLDHGSWTSMTRCASTAKRIEKKKVKFPRSSVLSTFSCI